MQYFYQINILLIYQVEKNLQVGVKQMDFNYEKPIIAVTGSAGKTMVKTLISAILRERWIIFESKDYYNTFQNTEEHVKQISFIHRAVVLEYGMAFPGAITEHCRNIQPNISVITNVGLAHIGNFEGKVENLAAAKSELIKGMNPLGILFINSDDENSKLLHTHGFTGTIFTVGIDFEADYKAEKVAYSENGMTFMVTLQGKDYEFLIPVFGIHNVYNALFSIGVADKLGFSPKEMQQGLSNVKKPNHRLDIHRLKDGITVIDDTVHAHPPAMKAAIDVLMSIATKKKIAVLGTMPELGEYSKEYHEDLGRYITTKNIDFLYTYGGYSVNIGLGAIAAGFPEDKVNHKKVAHRKILHQELVALIEPGTTILVKGASRLDMYETVRFLCDYYKIE
jgi:UDP-N-acetylmuramoyl-tripeptide--D-alanyl-D-alanine ligase